MMRHQTSKVSSFLSATATVCSAGKGSLLMKLVLKDAYRHIPICSTDWNLLGFQWEGKYYYPAVPMFSSKSIPYIFNLCIEVLHWIIEHHLPMSLVTIWIISCQYSSPISQGM